MLVLLSTSRESYSLQLPTMHNIIRKYKKKTAANIVDERKYQNMYTLNIY